jgi:protein-S-isoprenylcysteine O-methyltransferase Ste14
MNYTWIISGVWLVFFLYWGISARNVKETARAEPTLSRAIHLALFAGAFLLVGPDAFSFGLLGARFWPDGAAFIGVIVLIIGIAFAIWARYHLGQYWSGTITIKEGHKLIRTGPYGLVRHPIYTGIVVGMLGTAIATGEVRGLIALLLVIVAYIRKIGIEEGFLKAQFGDAYARYIHEVKALIPFIL